MDLGDELLTLAARHEEELGALFWASERDRWVELHFCVLNAFVDDPAETRQLVAVLDGAGLLAPDVLGGTSDASSASGLTLRFILQQFDLSQRNAERAASMLARIGRTIEEQYQGKIQRYLRRQGERIRDDLVAMFDDAQSEAELRRSVTHWLQNALGVPLSLDDQSVRKFREEHDIDLKQLEEAADEVDLNVALLDDVIRADRSPSHTAGGLRE